MRKPERVPEVLAQAKTSGSGGWVKKLCKQWQCYQIAMAVNVCPKSQKEQWIQGGKRGGNLNSQTSVPQENVWLRSILRDENFFVSHAKLTIFKASPTLSNLTELGSMRLWESWPFHHTEKGLFFDWFWADIFLFTQIPHTHRFWNLSQIFVLISFYTDSRRSSIYTDVEYFTQVLMLV